MASTPHRDFAEQLDRHRGIVLKIAATYAGGAEDRADLAQDIAIELWRAWPRYDPARPLSTWMYRIALNVGISFLRDDSRRRRHTVALDDGDAAAADDGDGHDRRDALRVLQRFTATLPPLDRALMVLYLDARSTREIADILGIGESNVTTKIARLKQRIRDFASPSSP